MITQTSSVRELSNIWTIIKVTHKTAQVGSFRRVFKQAYYTWGPLEYQVPSTRETEAQDTVKKTLL